MRRIGLSLLATLALTLAVGAPAASAAEGDHAVALGAYIPGSAEDPSLIDRYARLVGRKPVIVTYYKQWDFEPFVPRELDAIWSRGGVPMVTWEPQSYLGRSFSLRSIQRGRFDEYARRSARAAAAWGLPILVRFGHEMNGTWYPWARGVAGNNSYRLKAVWRRLVGIFRTQGADNVEWVWTPNVNTGGEFPFRDLYPGDAWVDWVGFDGFNWALRGEWNSFTDIVDNSYEEMAKISSRPMIVAETGSSQTGGDKAAWVASALRREIPKLDRIRAVVWFNDKFEDEGAESGAGLDARVNSSRASLRALRSAAALPLYSLTRRQLLVTSSDLSAESAFAPDTPNSGFGQPSLFYRLTHKLHGQYVWLAVGVLVAAMLLLAAAALLLGKRLRRRMAR
ncbi:MAG TPA: glycosyl hydrolase [Solirubrobacterales bacterium]